MYVTSDIFDLKRIGHFRDIDWRENLMGGVAVYGTTWPGREASAQFLVEAAKLCGLLDGMQYGGYSRAGDRRTRSIVPKSLVRLASGDAAVAKDAVGLLLRGLAPAEGTENGSILFGGTVSGAASEELQPGATLASGQNSPRPLRADFIFPLTNATLCIAPELLKMAVDLLGAEYGYYFVSDELCGPSTYAWGIGPALDYSPISNAYAVELRDWARFAREQLWVAPWPLLRDLYEVNLISERHTAQPIEGLGLLTEWIEAEPGRGRLRDLGRGRWLWTLTDLEIFKVRPVLHKAGLLLSCHDRIYRDLPGLSPPRRNNAAVSVRTTDQALYVLLADGRELSAPLGRFPRLRAATPEQRAHWHIFSEEQSISWPDVEEYIMVETLLRAR